MKKCPKGVICIENISMIVILLFVIIIVYLIYVVINKQNKQNIQITNQTNDKVVIKEEKNNGSYGSLFYPNYPYNNFPENVLLNPIYPPLNDERYLVPSLNYVPPGSIPINVSTNIGAVESSYRQVGILTPLNSTSKDNILPLMGRPVFIRRSLWNYYTISNQHNNVKLPVSVKGRSGLNDNGVDQLYSGDTVYIEGANEVYKVTIYENSTIKYIPFI
jgi:hypothetical protein